MVFFYSTNGTSVSYYKCVLMMKGDIGMRNVERKVSILERCVQLALALAISGSMFCMALVMQFFWQGCICLFISIVACEMLYVIAFWPKIEQVVGQNRSKLSLNVSGNQRSIALRQAFATSGIQTLIMLIVWVLFRLHILGGLILLSCVITDYLLWHKFHSCNCDVNRVCAQENDAKEHLVKKVKAQPLDGSCGNIFSVLMRHRLAIALTLISLITVRIIIMCMMYGCPSFCTRCVLYWGVHHSSYSGHHAEHSLLSVGISD